MDVTTRLQNIFTLNASSKPTESTHMKTVKSLYFQSRVSRPTNGIKDNNKQIK